MPKVSSKETTSKKSVTFAALPGSSASARARSRVQALRSQGKAQAAINKNTGCVNKSWCLFDASKSLEAIDLSYHEQLEQRFNAISQQHQNTLDAKVKELEEIGRQTIIDTQQKYSLSMQQAMRQNSATAHYQMMRDVKQLIDNALLELVRQLTSNQEPSIVHQQIHDVNQLGILLQSYQPFGEKPFDSAIEFELERFKININESKANRDQLEEQLNRESYQELLPQFNQWQETFIATLFEKKMTLETVDREAIIADKQQAVSTLSQEYQSKLYTPACQLRRLNIDNQVKNELLQQFAELASTKFQARRIG